MTNYMDNYLDWLESTTPEERLGRTTTKPTRVEHTGPCIYCEHGPYCPACPPPPVVADDAPVCPRCREQITRSEIAADPYYNDGAVFGDGT